MFQELGNWLGRPIEVFHWIMVREKKAYFLKKKMYITLSLAHTIFKIGGDD